MSRPLDRTAMRAWILLLGIGAIAWLAAEAPEPAVDCEGCPEMMPLKAGSFVMGVDAGMSEPEETPSRTVAIGAFALSRHEVTFAQWDACAADGACPDGISDEGWGRGLRPVINVSWEDAQRYVRWLSARSGRTYRLPTEAEWEYAIRSADTAEMLGRENLLPGSAVCWSGCGDPADTTLPVGGRRPNGFDIEDLRGNVWEWVEDCWHPDYNGAPTDGSAWTEPACTDRVVRGGGWSSRSYDLRPTLRSGMPANMQQMTVGFRVARGR